MYSYETFYDHYVILKDGEILYHVDTEAEAKKEIDLLSDNKNKDDNTDNIDSNKNYTVYHLHTEQSLLDSCTNYKLYVDRAKELRQTAICFSEHGNIYNWYEKKMYCDKMGIKYMHGIECYLTKTHEKKERDNYHTVLIAKNQKGFEELNRLIFESTKSEHFYYKPRISFEEFFNISDNIIKISACLASPLNRFYKEYKETNKMPKYLDDLLKFYDYYEIQYHDFSEQIDYNKWLYEMSKKYNKPLITGTDTHSINSYKAECRTILQLGKDIEFQNEDKFDLTYKSYDELIEMFKTQNSLPMNVILNAVENTNIMANSCEELDIDTKVKYPLLYGEKDEEVLWDTLRTKYAEKVNKDIIDPNNKQYVDNIKEEMRVFNKTNMTGFMLFMSEMMSWCKENDIPTSPCRGSVGGSTVAYISDIIDVDPVKWHTVFSRFCNEDRVEVGDIDCDFYEDDRPKVYNYIINRFGKENTAYILANGTVVDKGAIDLIGRALSKKWLKTHTNYEDNPYSLVKIKIIKEEYEKDANLTREKYPELFYYFDGILNTVVSQSQHPAGIVASPINLVDNCSIFIGNEGQYILPINMDEVHEIGLVKYDILGLRNIGIIKKCCEYANIKYPRAHEIDWNDQNVYKDMVTSPIGIFQFEGDYAFKLLKAFDPHNINDMSLVNASLRPSGESYRDRLIAHEPNHNPSEIIDELLAPNHGYLVFQEDVIAFLQKICGLSGSEADNVRRAIGRKQMDRLYSALPRILEGYCKMSSKPRDVAEEEAKTFLKIIEDASSYMFGFNHSTGYSMVGYLCAYMRYYYPKEFCCAFLNCSKSDEDIYNGTMLTKEKNILIESPKFRKSLNEFKCDPNENIIYKGLASIKDIGKNNGDDLYKLKDNKYNSFIDLLKDIKEKTSVNSKQLDILIKLDFFSEFGDINYLLYITSIYNKFGNSKVLTKSKLTEFETECAKKVCNKETEKQFRDFSPIDLLRELLNIDIPPTTLSNKIHYELKLLGYTDLKDETVDDNLYGVESVESNKYGAYFAKLYHINSGESSVYKIDKKYFKQYPLEQGDIIKCSFTDKEKIRKTDNGFIKTNEFEKILKLYSIQ